MVEFHISLHSDTDIGNKIRVTNLSVLVTAKKVFGNKVLNFGSKNVLWKKSS